MPRLRNFDTEPLRPYCYEQQPNDRLESVANAHTAADLHVRPWFSNRADLESRGRRERLKKYTMGDFSQCLDSRRSTTPRRRTRRSNYETGKQVFESPHRIVRVGRCHKSRCNSENF
ncbi:hypothetical protein [Bradyrhizobium canariense]|uniref:hypothetical protein n=1 Tax=Bradyrhizobium canariense TaxID=255045 RepID=UPI0011BA6E1F|nr:hypothetical protein [Bradyrhizobium canariense]